MARRKGQIGKLSGLNKDGNPNAHWKKFKERLSKYNETSVSDWKPEHALGHFIYRYQAHYDVDFTYSYSGAPGRSSEMYSIKRVIASLGTDSGEMIKDYIDWAFDKVIIPRKIQLSSIGFLFSVNLIRQFKAVYKKNKRISRTTQLPEQYETIASDLKVPVYTYGDLAFAKMAIDSSPDDYPEYQTLFRQLRDNGFDDSVLNTLE
jgi:hypothetical protein